MALDVDQFLHKWKTDPAGTPPRLINDLPAPEATEATKPGTVQCEIKRVNRSVMRMV
jgi:hypothetical protein